MGVSSTPPPPSSRGLRIGLLGGSFDPVHHAHLLLAIAARQHLALDDLQLLPAAQPWQRAPLGASAEHRLAMLRLAIAEHPGISINTLEIDRAGPTYTIDTLRELGAGENEHTYYWVLGSDQLANFCTWRAWEEIVRRVHLAVAERPGAQVTPPAALQQELTRLERQILPLPFTPTRISSTEIRNRVAAGLPIDGMTPPAVVDYIRTHRLYQA